ncbi:MAG: hypothetical protein M3R36_05520 [Bacteroidota bacterium]|nr:hypothetical protein [Bacteroidota bacterium]
MNNGSVYNYDFTNSNTQAYGDNLKLTGDKYCTFSGDVNQDGIIDLSDFEIYDNDVFIFRTGLRLPADLNGDNIVEIEDMLIADNKRFVQVITP